VGAVYLAMGDFDSAVQCHMEHLQIAKRLGNKVEEARAYSNLGKWATNSKIPSSFKLKFFKATLVLKYLEIHVALY
jgi:hypothetical protein